MFEFDRDEMLIIMDALMHYGTTYEDCKEESDKIGIKILTVYIDKYIDKDK